MAGASYSVPPRPKGRGSEADRAGRQAPETPGPSFRTRRALLSLDGGLPVMPQARSRADPC